MLKRPERMPTVGRGHALALQGRYNLILKECLAEEGGNLRLISIKVQDNEFDMTGHLTASGMNTFWREMDRGLKIFDRNKIKLLPRSSLKQQNENNSDRSPHSTHNKTRKPTSNASRHNESRSRSCSHSHSRSHSRASHHNNCGQSPKRFRLPTPPTPKYRKSEWRTGHKSYHHRHHHHQHY